MNYQIGPWQFIENRCVLTSANIERELDPLLVKLLLHFCSKPQQIVPRQELVEQVWQQSFVDDNAINRAISELRKQLAHPVEKAPLLKTHYRKGYSLTVPVQPFQSNQQPAIGYPEPSVTDLSSTPTNDSRVDVDETTLSVQEHSINKTPSKAATTKTLWLLSALIAVTLLLVLGYFFLSQTTQESTTGKVINTQVTVTPSTWNLGGESVPLMSFDKQYLAYSNTPPRSQVSRAFVKRLADQREIELHYKDYSVSIISWQHKLNKVLLQATKLTEQKCLMVLVDLTVFPKQGDTQVIRRCDLRYTGYAQLDKSGENLYFTEMKGEHTGAGLYRLNTLTERESTLVPPSDVLYGALMPRISPSETYVGYIHTAQGQPFSLFTYNLKTTETKRLFQAEEKVVSFAYDWLPDEPSVFISEFERLIRVNLETGEQTVRRISPAISPFYISAQSASSFYFSPSQTQQLSILSVQGLFSASTTETSLFQSQGNNYNAVRLGDDTQAGTLFISNRSGEDQLWLDANGQKTQLSNFSADTVSLSFGFIRAAKNEQYVLLKVNDELAFFDLQSKKLHLLPELQEYNITSFAWSADSEAIWFVEQHNKSYNLWRFNVLTREVTPHNQIQPYSLLTNLQGHSFAITNKALIRLDDNKRWVLPKHLKMASFHAINRDYLYFSDGISQVSRMNLTTLESQQRQVDFKSFTFSVTDDNELLFNRRSVVDTQIKLVSW